MHALPAAPREPSGGSGRLMRLMKAKEMPARCEHPGFAEWSTTAKPPSIPKRSSTTKPSPADGGKRHPKIQIHRFANSNCKERQTRLLSGFSCDAICLHRGNPSPSSHGPERVHILFVPAMREARFWKLGTAGWSPLCSRLKYRKSVCAKQNADASCPTRCFERRGCGSIPSPRICHTELKSICSSVPFSSRGLSRIFLVSRPDFEQMPPCILWEFFWRAL